jgi:serine/threonine protein kinase/tetratricopeptide (TPR) repeat protein
MCAAAVSESARLGEIFSPEVKRALPQAVIAHLGVLDRASLSLVSRHCYEIVQGESFAHLKGESDRYAVIPALRRQDAEQITSSTGLRIAFPAGRRHFGVVTSWDDRSTEKLCLGRGKFGVFCIGYALQARQFVGLKITEGSDEVEAELQMHQQLRGLPNLIESLDYCRVILPDGRVRLYQVLHLAGLGTGEGLREPLRELNDSELREGMLFHIAEGMLQAFLGMHSKGLCHLDLKPANLVFTEAGEPTVIDFGCSQQAEGGINGTTSLGDLDYRAPEWWECDGEDQNDPNVLCDGRAIDIWTVGATLFEFVSERRHLLTKEEGEAIFSLPFDRLPTELQSEFGPMNGASRRELLRSLVLGRLKGGGEFIGFVRELLALTPADRPGAQQALDHPWMVKMREQVDRAAVGGRLRELVQTQPFAQQPKVLSPQEKPLPHFVNYVSRSALETQLRERLLSGERVTVLQGPPGSGKTTLAQYIFHDPALKEHFGQLYWIRGADSAMQIEQQLLILARELGLASEQDQYAEVFLKLQGYLSSREQPTLIVYDNGDDPEMLRAYLPEGVSVLISSRSAQWQEGEKVAVGSLSRPESRALVRRLLGRELSDAEQLCEECRDHPLALVQACAFIRNRRLSIKDYIGLLCDSSDVLSQNEQQDGHRQLPYSIAGMYDLTFQQLRKLGALPLLHCLAQLGPYPITEHLVAALQSDEDRASGSLEALLDYAMIEGSAPDGYSLHPLTSQAVLRGLSTSQRDSALKTTIGVLSTYLLPSISTPEEESQQRWSVLPSVEILLQHCSETSSLAPQVFQKAIVLQAGLVEHLVASGMPVRAERWADDLLPRAEAHFKEGSQGHLRCLHAAASLNARMGRLPTARRQLENFLQLQRRASRFNDLQVARDLNSLAAVTLGMGDAASALRWRQQAYQIFRRAYPRDHREMIPVTRALGETHAALGDHRLAEECLRSALSIAEEASGEGTLVYADCLMALMRHLVPIGKGEEVIRLGYHTQAVSIYESVFGPSHPRLGHCCGKVGSMMFVLQQPREASHYLAREVEILDGVAAAPGELERSLLCLSEALAASGDYGAALKRLTRVMELSPTGHQRQVEVQLRMSEVHLLADDPQEAVEVIRIAAQELERAGRADSAEAAQCALMEGKALLALGDPEGALKSLRESLRIQQLTVGDSDPSLFPTLWQLMIAAQTAGPEYQEEMETYGEGVAAILSEHRSGPGWSFAIGEEEDADSQDPGAEYTHTEQEGATRYILGRRNSRPPVSSVVDPESDGGRVIMKVQAMQAFGSSGCPPEVMFPEPSAEPSLRYWPPSPSVLSPDASLPGSTPPEERDRLLGERESRQKCCRCEII